MQRSLEKQPIAAYRDKWLCQRHTGGTSRLLPELTTPAVKLRMHWENVIVAEGNTLSLAAPMVYHYPYVPMAHQDDQMVLLALGTISGEVGGGTADGRL